MILQRDVFEIHPAFKYGLGIGLLIGAVAGVNWQHWPIEDPSAFFLELAVVIALVLAIVHTLEWSQRIVVESGIVYGPGRKPIRLSDVKRARVRCNDGGFNNRFELQTGQDTMKITWIADVPRFLALLREHGVEEIEPIQELQRLPIKFEASMALFGFSALLGLLMFLLGLAGVNLTFALANILLGNFIAIGIQVLQDIFKIGYPRQTSNQDL